ncbi:MAG: pseudouridine synthase [Lachnospiraceae bacterium]|nr:pseudouridine synthase [Lachnospiraceae bacterium]
MEPVRLNKYLSEAGVCSRRQADAMIEEGRILVNGEPARTGMKVTPDMEIRADGHLVGEKARPVLLAVNKPRGIVCTTAEKEKDNIVDFLHYPVRIYPVGRLDKDSEGLILMTNQGDLVNRILRGSNRHEKEYIVQVNKPLTRDFLTAMRQGVPIPDTNKVRRSGSFMTEDDAPVVMTRPCQVDALGKNVFRIVLTQGLNRQIRRMCEYLDYRVTQLKRVRVLNVRLGDLEVGQYREITGTEYEKLMTLLENSSNLSYKQRTGGKSGSVKTHEGTD